MFHFTRLAPRGLQTIRNTRALRNVCGSHSTSKATRTNLRHHQSKIRLRRLHSKPTTKSKLQPSNQNNPQHNGQRMRHPNALFLHKVQIKPKVKVKIKIKTLLFLKKKKQKNFNFWEFCCNTKFLVWVNINICAGHQCA